MACVHVDSLSNTDVSSSSLSPLVLYIIIYIYIYR